MCFSVHDFDHALFYWGEKDEGLCRDLSESVFAAV